MKKKVLMVLVLTCMIMGGLSINSLAEDAGWHFDAAKVDDETRIDSSIIIKESATQAINDMFIDGNIINNEYFGIYKDDESKALNNVKNISLALKTAHGLLLHTVRLETGTYYVDTQSNTQNLPTNAIQIPSNMTFDLNDSTLIQITNNSPNYSILGVRNGTGITITNGTLIGDNVEHDYTTKTSTHEFGFGIMISNGAEVIISNMNIYDMTGDAVIIIGSEGRDIIVKDSVFHNCRRQGLSIVGGIDIQVLNCEIFNINGTSPGAGIDIEAESNWTGENITIKDCNIYNTYSRSILIHKRSKNVLVENNKLERGVSIIYGNLIRIKNNQIGTADKVLLDPGIVAKDTIYPTNIIIEDNTLINASIAMAINQGSVVQNNIIQNGTISFSCASGAIYNNTLDNSAEIAQKNYAIIVYADDHPISVQPPYNVYLYGNNITGNYLNHVVTSGFSGLTTTRTEKETLDYIAAINARFDK